MKIPERNNSLRNHLAGQALYDSGRVAKISQSRPKLELGPAPNHNAP